MYSDVTNKITVQWVTGCASGIGQRACKNLLTQPRGGSRMQGPDKGVGGACPWAALSVGAELLVIRRNSKWSFMVFTTTSGGSGGGVAALFDSPRGGTSPCWDPARMVATSHGL